MTTRGSALSQQSATRRLPPFLIVDAPEHDCNLQLHATDFASSTGGHWPASPSRAVPSAVRSVRPGGDSISGVRSAGKRRALLARRDDLQGQRPAHPAARICFRLKVCKFLGLDWRESPNSKPRPTNNLATEAGQECRTHERMGRGIERQNELSERMSGVARAQWGAAICFLVIGYHAGHAILPALWREDIAHD